MFSAFAFLVVLTLSNGDKYTPQVNYYPNFTECMNVAMVVTNSYRKSDLKAYTVNCVEVTSYWNQ